MMDLTLKKMVGGAMDSIADLKKEINSIKEAEENALNNPELNSIISELKKELEKIQKMKFTTALLMEDRNTISSVTKKIEAIHEDLNGLNLKELNNNITKIKEVTVVKKIEFSRSFIKFSYWLNGVAILSLVSTIWISKWWIESSTKEASAELSKAQEIKKSYEGFPEVKEWNWYVAFYNYFNSKHPKDTYKWEKLNPYPEKK